MVTMVLLKVALMWATPRLTLRRCLRFLLLATDQPPLKPLPPAPSPKRRGSDKAHSPSPLRGGGRGEGFEVAQPRISLTPFLPATVLRGPLRVRALVRV